MGRGWLLGAAAVMTVAGVAHADVVGPPPDDCPEGTQGQSCHGGPYCSPDACTTDGDCGAGETCAEVDACVGSVVCAGMLPPDADIEDYRVDTVEGLCPDGTCTSGDCRTVRLCVADSPPPGGGDDGGCGCRIAPPTGGSRAAWLVPLLPVALVLRRRARR